jgi:hypothetical protein
MSRRVKIGARHQCTSLPDAVPVGVRKRHQKWQRDPDEPTLLYRGSDVPPNPLWNCAAARPRPWWPMIATILLMLLGCLCCRRVG